jgi:subtilase family serine protease
MRRPVAALLAGAVVLTLSAMPLEAGAAGKRRVVLLGLERPVRPLARFANRVSAPGSELYGDYLSLSELRARYGARPGLRRRVLRSLRRAGVGSPRLDSTGSVVTAVMTPAAARRLFCARGDLPPRRGFCLPRELRGLVRQVVAGEIYRARRGGSGSAARIADGTPSGCGAALKEGAYTPSQVVTAYGVDTLARRGLDGSGVSVATMSPALIDPGPIHEWAQCFGLPAPAFHQASMPGGGLETSAAPEETYLDAEALAAIAPRLERITAINVPQDQSFRASFALFMLGALDPRRHGGRLPDVLSISDGACESVPGPAEIALGQHLLRAATALGISALAASGDVGFLGCELGSGASWPAASRYVTAVGGTSIALNPANRIVSQLVWSTFASEGRNGAGSGGGPSSRWARPSWQRAPGVGPALQPGRPRRLTPDLAAMASFEPGLAVLGGYGGWGGGGGTSAATPLVAGIVALVEQQERAAGRPSLGAPNPLLYRMARGPLYADLFWDVIAGTSSPRPASPLGMSPAGGAAQPGYDLATGLGSPRAAPFAAAVAVERAGLVGG